MAKQRDGAFIVIFHLNPSLQAWGEPSEPSARCTEHSKSDTWRALLHCSTTRLRHCGNIWTCIYLCELLLQHLDFIWESFLLLLVLPETLLQSLVLPFQILNENKDKQTVESKKITSPKPSMRYVTSQKWAWWFILIMNGITANQDDFKPKRNMNQVQNEEADVTQHLHVWSDPFC